MNAVDSGGARRPSSDPRLYFRDRDGEVKGFDPSQAVGGPWVARFASSQGGDEEFEPAVEFAYIAKSSEDDPGIERKRSTKRVDTPHWVYGDKVIWEIEPGRYVLFSLEYSEPVEDGEHWEPLLGRELSPSEVTFYFADMGIDPPFAEPIGANGRNARQDTSLQPEPTAGTRGIPEPGSTRESSSDAEAESRLSATAEIRGAAGASGLAKEPSPSGDPPRSERAEPESENVPGVVEIATSTEPPAVKPARRAKEPHKRAMTAYRLLTLAGLKQEDVAQTFCVNQSTISRWRCQVAKWMEAGNVLPDEMRVDPVQRKPIAMDPSKLDQGPRLNRRRNSPREKEGG
jgi:hypothetical protein